MGIENDSNKEFHPTKKEEIKKKTQSQKKKVRVKNIFILNFTHKPTI